jgi:hypothetical protein
MAKNQNTRLRPPQLQRDATIFASLTALNDYAPANKNYSLAAVQGISEAMKAAQRAELNAQNALASARDLAAAAEWEFHNAILRVKEQVIAQYGHDSNEVQALGVKKKSEYKAPGRKRKSAA